MFEGGEDMLSKQEESESEEESEEEQELNAEEKAPRHVKRKRPEPVAP